MGKDVILSKTFNGEKFRIVTYRSYNYFDEIGGSVKTDRRPEFREAYTQVQIKTKVLFIFNYWRTLKEYYSKKETIIGLQEYNALKWYYKNIENNG